MNDSQTSPEMPLNARLLRLQRIVAELERDDIELEEAMKLFEEGIAHLREADQLVSRTELRIERLLEEAGQVRTEPLHDE